MRVQLVTDKNLLHHRLNSWSLDFEIENRMFVGCFGPRKTSLLDAVAIIPPPLENVCIGLGRLIGVVEGLAELTEGL